MCVCVYVSKEEYLTHVFKKCIPRYGYGSIPMYHSVHPQIAGSSGCFSLKILVFQFESHQLTVKSPIFQQTLVYFSRNPPLKPTFKPWPCRARCAVRCVGAEAPGLPPSAAPRARPRASQARRRDRPRPSGRALPRWTSTAAGSSVEKRVVFFTATKRGLEVEKTEIT